MEEENISYQDMIIEEEKSISYQEMIGGFEIMLKERIEYLCVTCPGGIAYNKKYGKELFISNPIMKSICRMCQELVGLEYQYHNGCPCHRCDEYTTSRNEHEEEMIRRARHATILFRKF